MSDPYTDGNMEYGGTSDVYESVLHSDVAGAGLTITPTLLSWTESRTIFGFKRNVTDPLNTQFMLMDAYKTMKSSQFPDVGEGHPAYKDAYVVSATLYPKSDKDSVNVLWVGQYQMPGDKCEVSYDTYQQTEIRNFTDDKVLMYQNNKTNIAIVPYPPGLLAQEAGKRVNTGAPFVADVPVPSMLKSVRVTQYEALTGDHATPAVLSQMLCPRPVWNSEPIWGYEAGKLLYVGRTALTDGTPIHRTTYNFLINQYGWHHFYAIHIQMNGTKLPDVVPFNPDEIKPMTPSQTKPGAGAFRMLAPADFKGSFTADRLGLIKPPFNTDTTPLPLPPSPPNIDGDFPAMPGNFV